MIEPWLQHVVDDFWTAAGEQEPFPRRLERPVLWALPLAIVKLPRLWVRDVRVWLAQLGVPFSVSYADRPLHGCSIAYSGKGVVLLDGSDPEEERRFSLAHEVAHLLLDYLRPRQLAISRLGGHIREVLDGLRPPTLDERVNSLLSHTPLGVHTHLMTRRSDRSMGCGRVIGAEYLADRLALELLAPAVEVYRRLTPYGSPGAFPNSGFHGLRPVAQLKERVTALLTVEFGLPQAVAGSYARALCRAWSHGSSFRGWLGI